MKPLPTLTQLQASLRKGELSPAEAIDWVAAQISATDDTIDAYVHWDIDAAKAEAAQADLQKPLGGLPIAIKDVLNVEGQPCWCASKLLQGYTAPYSATAINKLRAAGAIPFGRTNMDEFAMGSSTENSALKTTRNPWDHQRIPGGSSGGSAAAVAARSAVAALGTDTGGSIRQPAALCGVTGLKPTYGRVSRYGLVAFASSLDQIGPIAQNVQDAALLFDAIAGHDPRDSTSLRDSAASTVVDLPKGVKGLKIGLPKEYFIDGIDPEIEAAVRKAVDDLVKEGAEVEEISLPHTEYAVAVYYIIATAEASANLARFDGVRYGARVDQPGNLIDLYQRTRAQGFGPEVKRRIILGTYVLSSGYYDAYYLRAQKVRTLIRQDFLEAFKKVDVILSPTTPGPAFMIGERSSDPLQMYLADVFTIATNLAGLPGLSIPCGFTQSTEKPLPIGLQILGKPMDENTVLRVGQAYENLHPWARCTPYDAQPSSEPTVEIKAAKGDRKEKKSDHEKSAKSGKSDKHEKGEKDGKSGKSKGKKEK
ncbi:MAG: Asp-tRNA(Asn)/Glu-tRNA(Gln) amidotransferase subunit GatA [Verrucomicrobiales bacterium]